MNWKWKAAVQKACALLPVGSDQIYYLLQRQCGGLVRGYDPSFLLSEAARMNAVLRRLNIKLEDGARVMEVGTGWRLDIPLGLYLCGAREIHTYDLHPYLKESLVLRSVDFIRANRLRVFELFSKAISTKDVERRLTALCAVRSLAGLMELANIHFHAPADAAQTGLPAASIDIHLSYTVLEHIPGEVLEQILREANRILSARGVTIHHIDLTDHFYQVDPAITPVNFLQFSDRQWAKYAANQWAYHNRLRVNAYRRIYEKTDQEILSWDAKVDQRSLAALEGGFPLDPQFHHTPYDQLCTTILEVVSRPRSGPAGN